MTSPSGGVDIPMLTLPPVATLDEPQPRTSGPPTASIPDLGSTTRQSSTPADSVRADDDISVEAGIPLLAMWQASRLYRLRDGTIAHRVPGEARPGSRAAYRLAFQLAYASFGPFFALITADQQLRLAIYVACNVVKGLVPSARVWATSRLLVMVQQALGGDPINTTHLFCMGVAVLILKSAKDLIDYIFRDNNALIKERINFLVERAYLKAYLSLSIAHNANPTISAVMAEASLFACFASRETRDQFIIQRPIGSRSLIEFRSNQPYDHLSTLFDASTILLTIVTQLALLVFTIAGIGRNWSFSWGLPGRRKGRGALSALAQSAKGKGESKRNPAQTRVQALKGLRSLFASNSSFYLVAGLSILPSVFEMFSTWLMTLSERRSVRKDAALQQNPKRHMFVRLLGTDPQFKQETVLFGLQDWILGVWERHRLEGLQSTLWRGRSQRAFRAMSTLVDNAVFVTFNILLALRALPNVTLGSIQLYKDTGADLVSQTRQLKRHFTALYNLCFLISSYMIAISLPAHLDLLRPLPHRHSPMLNYEDYRQPDGMELRASGLSYTYPGADRPVLRNVNLHVRAGETLAIVGFNGGGKTTLVKVLMGLYLHDRDSSTSLTINGRDIGAYDLASIHARTSCLFQDFAQYGLTLGENVGLGLIDKMCDSERVEAAIERGGAQAVRATVGLDGWLMSGTVVMPAGGGGRGRRSAEYRLTWRVWAREWIHWLVSALLVRTGLPPLAKPVTAKRPKKSSAKNVAQGSAPLLLGAPARADTNTAAQGNEKAASATPGAIVAITPGNALIRSDMGALEGQGIVRATEQATSLPAPSPKKPTSNRNYGLSGGQWQRVALSRAFMRAGEADLVVFDEPSSALDPRAEAELFERIYELSARGGGKRATTIYISHRFHTDWVILIHAVRRADRIAFMENGGPGPLMAQTIIEHGTHAELMLLNGRYAELYNLQKSGFDDAPPGPEQGEHEAVSKADVAGSCVEKQTADDGRDAAATVPSSSPSPSVATKGTGLDALDGGNAAAADAASAG